MFSPSCGRQRITGGPGERRGGRRSVPAMSALSAPRSLADLAPPVLPALAEVAGTRRSSVRAGQVAPADDLPQRADAMDRVRLDLARDDDLPPLARPRLIHHERDGL